MEKVAGKKSVIQKDIFIYRVKIFPLSWFEKIKKIDDITITKEDVQKLCDDVLYDRDNSLKIK